MYIFNIPTVKDEKREFQRGGRMFPIGGQSCTPTKHYDADSFTSKSLITNQ